MQTIGFIGTGVMGSSIIKNLLAAGYVVNVYNRTKAHAQTVISAGAHWYDTPGKLTLSSDCVLTMVGYPTDVEELYFGAHGILANARPNQILIDLTTSTPTLAKKIYTAASKIGAAALDAPVSGGDVGAKLGTLTIMVGGDTATFTLALPIFKVIGQEINHFGAIGNGQHTKMANQIMIAATMVGLSEMLVYAKEANLDLTKVLNTVGSGSAANWSMTNYAPRILKNDFAPGFYAKHLLKDLRIALDEAQKMNLALPGTQLAETLYKQLTEDKNLGNEGTQALVKLWQQFS